MFKLPFSNSNSANSIPSWNARDPVKFFPIQLKNMHDLQVVFKTEHIQDKEIKIITRNEPRWSNSILGSIWNISWISQFLFVSVYEVFDLAFAIVVTD